MQGLRPSNRVMLWRRGVRHMRWPWQSRRIVPFDATKGHISYSVENLYLDDGGYPRPRRHSDPPPPGGVCRTGYLPGWMCSRGGIGCDLEHPERFAERRKGKEKLR